MSVQRPLRAPLGLPLGGGDLRGHGASPKPPPRSPSAQGPMPRPPLTLRALKKREPRHPHTAQLWARIKALCCGSVRFGLLTGRVCIDASDSVCGKLRPRPAEAPTAEFFAQRAAGQSGPRPPRWGPRAAAVAGWWGLCSPALFGFSPPESRSDPGNRRARTGPCRTW